MTMLFMISIATFSSCFVIMYFAFMYMMAAFDELNVDKLGEDEDELDRNAGIK